jgi:putative phosphoribosyl transferase
MAALIAEALGGDLDIVLVHKLRAQGQPELAIGAIEESGRIDIGEYARMLGMEEDYLRKEIAEQLATLRRRRALYTPARPPIDPAGRVVIIVDDGIATGSTVLAAIRAVKVCKPAKLIVATAVAPADTIDRLKSEVDEIVCLEAPAFFYAIGAFFDDFSQVSDEDVVAVLRRMEDSSLGARHERIEG